jgi:anti-repressor protein
MELIKIAEAEIAGAVVQTVNARDLHAFLENRDHFATWVGDRIRQYDFKEGVDFVSFSESSEKGGRPRVEYALTIDMAKELAMVERNEKGKQARLYFIECERRAKAHPTIDVRNPSTLTSIALQLIEVNKELEARAAAAEKIAAEAQEDARAFGVISKSDGSVCMTDAAKALHHRPKDLIDYLKSHSWIYRRAGGDHWVAYQTRIQAGDLEHKVTTVLRADGTEKITEQVKITPQGLAKLAKLFPPRLKVA